MPVLARITHVNIAVHIHFAEAGSLAGSKDFKSKT